VCVCTVCSSCFYGLWYEQWPSKWYGSDSDRRRRIDKSREESSRLLCMCACTQALDRFVIREIEILKIVAGREKAEEEEREDRW
jgi:hypothetical protein